MTSGVMLREVMSYQNHSILYDNYSYMVVSNTDPAVFPEELSL